MAEAQISCQNICKRYHKGGEVIEVLSGASCAVMAGEMVSVIGKSGAGKSTFLHVLGSLDTPDEGRLWCMGQPLDRLSPVSLAEFRNRHMGFCLSVSPLVGRVYCPGERYDAGADSSPLRAPGAQPGRGRSYLGGPVAAPPPRPRRAIGG